MIIAILGRQPALSIAELERCFGSNVVTPFSRETAVIETSNFDVSNLGGIQKAGTTITTLNTKNWNDVRNYILRYYEEKWHNIDYKITLGISAYGIKANQKDIQKMGVLLKSKLKKQNVSMRLIPNTEPALNTATSHHNKLGLSPNKIEIIIVSNGNGKVIIAESVGAQNITALARRDQQRPKRSAFVGMLPPKLARMMVNYAIGDMLHEKKKLTILDPFCGTGVALQEALLLNCNVYGTDIQEKMVDYTTKNLEWLKETHHTNGSFTIKYGDAMSTKWQEPVDAIVCETYLGQPFSAPPSPQKLKEVVGNCNHIIGSFLNNLHKQIDKETRICIAVPCWKNKDDTFTHLPLTRRLQAYGFERTALHHVSQHQLLYYRENQVVARELLILQKTLTKQ